MNQPRLTTAFARFESEIEPSDHNKLIGALFAVSKGPEQARRFANTFVPEQARREKMGFPTLFFVTVFCLREILERNKKLATAAPIAAFQSGTHISARPLHHDRFTRLLSNVGGVSARREPIPPQGGRRAGLLFLRNIHDLVRLQARNRLLPCARKSPKLRAPIRIKDFWM